MLSVFDMGMGLPRALASDDFKVTREFPVGDRLLEFALLEAACHRVVIDEAMLQSASIRHYAQPLTLNNLWMIPCGGAADHPQVMRNSERIKIRFEELRRQFDFVLLNAPSMSMTANLTQLAKLADGVIFVIEANSTRRETTRRLKESLQEIQARVLGVVLNDRRFPIPASVYRKL